MNEEICPVKVERRLRAPTKKINPYHEWLWERNGKDGRGATLKRGVCKLCGFDLGVERFCRRCGVILPEEEPEALCTDCMGKEAIDEDVSEQSIYYAVR